MRKQNKNMCFDIEVLDFLDSQGNASALVQDLIYAEMKRLNDLKKDKNNIDISKLHEDTTMAKEAEEQRQAARAARNKAWELLDLQVREEIKDLPDWGPKWKDIFYPMYVQNGEKLELDEVRRWYFANKDGYKQ